MKTELIFFNNFFYLVMSHVKKLFQTADGSLPQSLASVDPKICDLADTKQIPQMITSHRELHSIADGDLLLSDVFGSVF